MTLKFKVHHGRRACAYMIEHDAVRGRLYLPEQLESGLSLEFCLVSALQFVTLHICVPFSTIDVELLRPQSLGLGHIPLLPGPPL